MSALTYELWNEIIEDVIDGHASLFEAMHQAADGLRLSREIVEEIKDKGVKEIDSGPWHFVLSINLHSDEIGGFRISLFSSEDLEALWQIKAKALTDHGLNPEDLEGFEIEHGLEMDEEIFEGMGERFGIFAATKEDEIIFELLLFDSQDIDNSIENEEVWGEGE